MMDSYCTGLKNFVSICLMSSEKTGIMDGQWTRTPWHLGSADSPAELNITEYDMYKLAVC